MSNPKKRKEDISSEVEKKDDGSFTHIHISAQELRKNLNSPEVFSLIKDYFFQSKNENNISNYISAGGSIAELCQLLTSMDMKKKDEVCLIFSVLQLIILKLIDVSQDQNQLKDDCKQLMANYIGEFQSLLTSKTSVKNKKIILRLLATVAAVSPTLAGLILSTLTLTRDDIDALVEHVDPSDEKSLRVSFIHFILAFMIEQTPKVLEKLLSKKVWLPSIFPGLQYDIPFTVKLVLSTLEARLVDNKDLSKTSKLYAFNTMSLFQLSELYNWNPKAWYDKKPNKTSTYPGQISEDDKIEIRTLTHGLLLKLCTSVKIGIAFHDPTYGTSNVQRNYTISNFLQKLGQPWEDSLKRDLLHKTLKTCPDILKSVLASLQPRLKIILPNWLEVLELVVQIVSDVKLDLTNQDPKNYFSLVRDLVVPHHILEAISSGQLLKCKTSHEKLTTLKLLFIILNRYKEVSRSFLKDHEDYSSAQKNIIAYLISNLPNCFDLLECLKISYGNMEYDVVKELIKLFTFYEQICPEMVDIIRYDETVSNWVREYVSTFDTSNTCDISLLLSMVRLEIIVNPQDAYQEHYIERLKYITLGKESDEVKLGLDIMKELLYKSGIFIRNESELSLWMYCMEKYYNTGIGSLMAESLKWALENLNSIYQTLMEVQEYSSDNSISGLNLDDFLKLSENDDVPGLEASVDSLFNLSPLLPSVLHIISENSYNDSDEFIVAFLVHYFHRQAMIQPYISLIKKYSCPTVMKVMPYFESWLAEPVPIDIPPFNKSVYYNALRSILSGKKFNDEMAKETLNDIKTRELLLEEGIFVACELSRLGQAATSRLDQISNLLEVALADCCLQVPLCHPALLDNFHPLLPVGDSDLTDLILKIAEHCELPLKTLAPFSHRLAVELKYAKKKCYNLKDDSKLLKLLNVFKFSKSDLEDLMDFVFSIKAKYYENDGKLSPWSTVLNYLLKESVELKIVINEKNLKNLINVTLKLIEKDYDISDICEGILKHFETFEIDISGTLLDSVKDLFDAMSTAAIWYEGLCIYIFNVLGKVDLTNIPIERTITLLSSLKKIKKRHREVVLDSSRIIFNGLCESPSPKWLKDLIKIIDETLPVETCKKVCKCVKKHPKEVFISTETLLVIKDLFIKSEETYSLYKLIIDWLRDEITKPKESFNQVHSEDMCNILIEILMSDIDLSGLDTTDNDLMMHLLLEGLRLPSKPILDLLHFFVEKNLTKLPPREVFELLTSHSSFLDVLLEKNNTAKRSCLKLMLVLISKDNSLINAKHVPSLLSCYGATLSKTDQIILKILFIYEKVGGINLTGWKPYVWGEAALDHYSVRSKLTTVKPCPTITLDLFEKDMVLRTVSEFPLDRTLDGDYEKEDGSIYDPAFYLPLLSQVTSEKIVGWKLAGNGALALTLVGLSSIDDKIRAASYHVLQRMYANMEDHKDNLIWRHFIEALRGGIVNLNEKENVRLSSIITIFLARASVIMAFPDDPLYFSLHNFLFAKPHLKLNTVPAFFEMFHHTQGNQKLHQRWILEVIKDGIKEQSDLQLALNCLTFKFILAYHFCHVSTPKTKQLIEEIVAKSIDVDEKQLLINNYSIIPWILGAKSNTIDNLPQNISSQYKPLVDVMKQRILRT